MCPPLTPTPCNIYSSHQLCFSCPQFKGSDGGQQNDISTFMQHCMKNSHVPILSRSSMRPASFCPFASFSFYCTMNSITQKAHSLSKTSTHTISFEQQDQRKANNQTRETCRAGWEDLGCLWSAWMGALPSSFRSFSKREEPSGQAPASSPAGQCPLPSKPPLSLHSPKLRAAVLQPCAVPAAGSWLELHF